MKIDLVAKCLLDPPYPSRVDLDAITDEVMDALVEMKVDEPAVSVEFEAQVIEIELIAEGDGPVEAFALGRRQVLDAIRASGLLVSRLDDGVPTVEPTWELRPEMFDADEGDSNDETLGMQTA